MCVRTIVEDGFQQLAKDLTENNLYLHFLEEEDMRCVCVCMRVFNFIIGPRTDEATDEATEESQVPQLKAALNHNIEK